MAGRERNINHSPTHRRATDRPAYKAAQRAERVVIAAIAALAARSAGQDITRGVILLVIAMAVAELTDWLFFQRGYRLLFRDLAYCEDPRSRVRSTDTARGNGRRKKRSRARRGSHKKIAD